MKIKMWDALNSEESDAKEIEISEFAELSVDGSYLGAAVRDFVEKRWAGNDYLETTEINVRIPSGKLLEFTVYAEPSVDFRVTPRR